MWFKYGLKAQKLIAQGIALGIMAISKAPVPEKIVREYRKIAFSAAVKREDVLLHTP